MDETYNDYMSRLSPCSSRVTAVSSDSSEPRCFRAEDFENLFSQRINELSKYGTLTESVSTSDDKLSPEYSDELAPSAPEDVLGPETHAQPTHITLILQDCSTVTVTLQEIKQFLMEHLHVRDIHTESLAAVHLIIYYYARFSVRHISQIRLYHMGKPHSVSSIDDLCIRKSLVNDLDVAKFPSFHVMVNTDITRCPFALSIQEMVYESFSLPLHQHYSVTYAEAIYYKLKSLKTRKSRKQRFRALRAMLHI